MLWPQYPVKSAILTSLHVADANLAFGHCKLWIQKAALAWSQNLNNRNSKIDLIYIWKKKRMLNQDLIKELQTSQRTASHLENNVAPNIFLGYFQLCTFHLSLVCLFPKVCFTHNTKEIQIMKFLTILYEILWSLTVPTGLLKRKRKVPTRHSAKSHLVATRVSC